MIALITGYYKVYVDNTSNTPLPVENDEKWPFAFLREPNNDDGRHHIVYIFCIRRILSFMAVQKIAKNTFSIKCRLRFKGKATSFIHIFV